MSTVALNIVQNYLYIYLELWPMEPIKNMYNLHHRDILYEVLRELTSLPIHIHIYMCVCVCICMYTYIYIHKYIHISVGAQIFQTTRFFF
jgi:hypothetical protein